MGGEGFEAATEAEIGTMTVGFENGARVPIYEPPPEPPELRLLVSLEEAGATIPDKPAACTRRPHALAAQLARGQGISFWRRRQPANCQPNC